MKPGDLYKTSYGDIYLVIGDYGKVRPLMLQCEAESSLFQTLLFQTNQSHYNSPSADDAELKNGFYEGDVKIGTALGLIPKRESQ